MLINYKNVPGSESNHFQNFLKLSEEIKTLNRKIFKEKAKIVKEIMNKNSENPEASKSTLFINIINKICKGGFEFLTNVPHLKEKELNLFMNDEINDQITKENNDLKENRISDKNKEKASKEKSNTEKPKKKRNLLCISAKNNSLQKYGRPKNKEEHMKRVLTRENTPCAHYNLQPMFTSRKEINMKELKAYFVEFFNLTSFNQKNYLG